MIEEMTQEEFIRQLRNADGDTALSLIERLQMNTLRIISSSPESQSPVGWTNEYQLSYLQEGGECAVFPDTKYEGDIPVYTHPVYSPDFKVKFFEACNAVFDHYDNFLDEYEKEKAKNNG